MIELTNTAGKPVYVGKEWVQAVREPRVNEYPRAAKAVLVLSGENMAVLETVAEVIAKLRAGL